MALEQSTEDLIKVIEKIASNTTGTDAVRETVSKALEAAVGEVAAANAPGGSTTFLVDVPYADYNDAGDGDTPFLIIPGPEAGNAYQVTSAQWKYTEGTTPITDGATFDLVTESGNDYYASLIYGDLEQDDQGFMEPFFNAFEDGGGIYILPQSEVVGGSADMILTLSVTVVTIKII